MPDRTGSILESQYRLSPSSLFHYRLPAGWAEHPVPKGEPLELDLGSADGMRAITVSGDSIFQLGPEVIGLAAPPAAGGGGTGWRRPADLCAPCDLR